MKGITNAEEIKIIGLLGAGLDKEEIAEKLDIDADKVKKVEKVENSSQVKEGDENSK